MLRGSDIRLLVVVALALASGGVLHQATATDCCRGDVRQEWVARYGGPGGGWNHAFDLGVDGSSNVCVTGQSEGSGTGDDYATIKYGPDGTEQWVARYDGPASGSDWAWALAIDSLDYVYVTGHSYGSGTGNDYTTIKYGPDGTARWVARYDGPSSSSDTAWALAIDASDNVYVTGGSYGTGTATDYATIKYSPDGTERWVARYDGPAGGGENALALAVDASGNVYVTGQSQGADTDDDYATVKYGPDGSELWAARYDGPGSGQDKARDVAVDGAGNVYVTGGSCDPGGADITECDYATIKYGPEGGELWVARYDGPGSEFDWACDLAVDGGGNVYVTGQTDAGPPTDSDFTTIKYSPEGGELWIARYDGPASGSDQARALAVDAPGNAYVTGHSQSSNTQSDYATIKYGPDGSQRWIARYDGPVSSNERAHALAIDGSGNVYVTGGSGGYGTSWDYATVKYTVSTVRMQKDVTEDPMDIVDEANLWLCEGPTCDNDGEGSLTIVERVFNVDYDPDGAGAYEFQLKFDHKLFDITIEDASWLSNEGTRDVECDMTVITENWFLFGCVSTGPVPGNTTDGIIATITVLPEPDMVNRLTPGNDNGVYDVLLDENCEVTDPLGHPLEIDDWCCDGIDNDGDTVIDEFGEGLAPGVVSGGIIEECGDFGITIRILEGDVNLDCQVDVLDQQAIAFRYGATFGTVLYDDFYDLEPWSSDFDIDIKDLQKVFGRDGSTCQHPIPDQPPVPYP